MLPEEIPAPLPGAVMWRRTTQGALQPVRCDVLNDVPHLPPPTRHS